MNAFGFAIVLVIILVLLIGRSNLATESKPTEPLKLLFAAEPVPVIAGQSFVYTIGATGGWGERSFSVDGAPEWLELDPPSGTLFGVGPVPRAGAASLEAIEFVVHVRDESGQDVKPLQIELFAIAVPFDPVSNPLTILDPRPLPRARVDRPYRFPLPVRGAVEPLAWSVVPDGAPTGLLCDGGVIEWTPTAPGVHEFAVRAEWLANEWDYRGRIHRWSGANAEQQIAIEVLPLAPPGVVAATGRVGEPLAVALSDDRLALGERFVWTSECPSLVPTLDGGALVGVPTVAGRFAVRCQTVDSSGLVEGRSATALVVVLPATSGLRLGESTMQAWLDEDIAFDLPYAGAIEPVILRSVGPLPAGLEIVGNRLAGRPAVVGIHTLRISLEDHAGRKAEGEFRIRVGPRF